MSISFNSSFKSDNDKFMLLLSEFELVIDEVVVSEGKVSFLLDTVNVEVLEIVEVSHLSLTDEISIESSISEIEMELLAGNYD